MNASGTRWRALTWITPYERIKAKADWYNRMETDVVRMVAVKTR